VVISCSLLAAAVVLRHLGTKPLWLDEAVSVSVARRPLPRLLSVLPHRDANAGLYYLLLHWWLRFGRSAGWDRGLSALSFVATAGLAAWVTTRWRGAWAGLSVGTLVAVNPFLVFYGQEARPYAPAVLLAVASTAALVWHDGRPAPKVYVAVTTALLYMDLFAALFVVAQAGALTVCYRRRGRQVPPTITRSWLKVAALSAPIWLAMTLFERGQIAWIGRPTLGYLGHAVTAMAGGRAALVVMGGLSLWAGWALARRGARRDRLVVAVLASSCAVPPVALWLFAHVVPSFVDRYVICSAIALVALAALGLDHARHRAGAAAALILLAFLAGSGLGRVAAMERAPFKYENPPAVAAFIGARTQPGDAIGFGSGGLRTVIDVSRPACRPFPDDVALAPGGDAWRQPDAYAREVSPAVLAGRLSRVRRLWLVTDPSDRGYPSSGPLSALRGPVEGEYRLQATAAFPGMTVSLYARP
jgi:mannosyltransferase